MTKRSKIILFSGIALIVVGIIFYPQINKKLSVDNQSLSNDKNAKQSNRKRTLLVNAQIIKNSKLIDNFRTKGILIPDEEVDLSFETSGKITEILFSEGSAVQKNQLLAKVNDKPLQAELTKLKTQLPLAQERVNRQKTLLEKDAVSQEAYESVNTELEKLRADIELVQTRIAQTELRAPFDGVLGLRLVSEGAYASPQTIITKLTKISPIKLEFSVNERQESNIHKGTKVNFSIEGYENNTYQALVYAVESKLDEATLSLKVRASYPNSDGKIKPGHSASVDIILREINDAIVIPSMAVTAEMGRDLVYIYNNGKAEQREIKKGIRTASSLQVLSGLSIGDTLLITGVMQLHSDTPVEIDNIQ
ncbi:MAG: efflux RND transporter periplasmic adaptor subunit [Paludibacter sp.]|jgi:membrane fusion protein (multidrug efflux system)|nr:efflux RND transporter periplasmic adaptor subunit [Paludibacter sp.]